MKVIVAAVDFSPAGSAAMRRAAQLAAGFGARLALLHVAAHRTPWERIAKAALPLAELRRQAAQVVAEHRIAVEAHLAKGAPHREIASFSREAKADLIVLGVRDSWIQDLLGSARAQRVRRRAAVPVLAVAGEPTGPYKRILVLLHVCPRLPGKAQTSRLVQALQDLAAFALRTGLGGARLEVCAGEAAATIDACAERIGADLVVVGPASKSWLGERLFFDVPDAMLSAPRRDTLIGAAARRLRQRSFNQDSPGSSAWDRTARNSASASRAPTVA